MQKGAETERGRARGEERSGEKTAHPMRTGGDAVPAGRPRMGEMAGMISHDQRAGERDGGEGGTEAVGGDVDASRRGGVVLFWGPRILSLPSAIPATAMSLMEASGRRVELVLRDSEASREHLRSIGHVGTSPEEQLEARAEFTREAPSHKRSRGHIVTHDQDEGVLGEIASRRRHFCEGGHGVQGVQHQEGVQELALQGPGPRSVRHETVTRVPVRPAADIRRQRLPEIVAVEGGREEAGEAEVPQALSQVADRGVQAEDVSDSGPRMSGSTIGLAFSCGRGRRRSRARVPARRGTA